MITLERISKLFKTEAATVAAVDDVSLHIKAGEIFGIIGFSGAGNVTPQRLCHVAHSKFVTSDKAILS